MIQFFDFLLLSGAAFLFSWFLTWLLLKNAVRARLLDIPNERSSHTVATPRGGGLSIVIIYTLAILLLVWQGSFPRSFISLVLAGILVAVIGLLDDRRHIAAGMRLFVHFLAVALGLICLDSVPSFPWLFGAVFSDIFVFLVFLVALVWVINLNNFMDGIDGLAAVETICVAGGAAVILWLNSGAPAFIYVLLLLVAATSGFLVWNWPPAKIFMGDACSGFLGLSLGLLALITSAAGGINIWSWVILYGVFIVDATYTLFVRILSGQRFYEAHRSHTYQILSRQLKSHKKVTLGVMAVNIFWLFPLAVVSSRYSNIAFLFVVAALAPLLLIALKAGAGKVVD